MNISSFLLLLFPLGILSVSSDPKKESKNSAKLPPCAACVNLVTSFTAGLDRTARGKLEGGDTAWEEKTQKSGYARSEVRFVEIQEKLCSDVDRGETQCHDNHHHWEEHLESWWNYPEDQLENRPDLRTFLCIDKLKVCCPDGHYGPDCKPCSDVTTEGPDGQRIVCSGNGKCKGSGTRKGNGKCACETGYSGELCQQCALGFYNSYKDDSKILCSPCHKGCKDLCNGPGPKACAACKSGFTMDTEHGCTDLDECIVSRPCAGNKFCVNTEGSFRCMNCDKACDGCESDGPDSCTKCAEGYQKNKDGVCISDETAGNEDDSGNKDYENEKATTDQKTEL